MTPSGNLVSMQNQTTGGSQRYGYARSDRAPADRGRAQQRQQRADARPARRRPPTSSATSAAPAQFAGTTINNTLAAGSTDLFSFRFDQNELNSTATGSVLLRVLVQGTDGTFVPATPTIAGLQPLSVNTQGKHRRRACS